MMLDFEGTLCDVEPPVGRKKILRIVFNKDIFLPRGFLDREVVKGKVLDLGCGRGSVGAMLKEINPEIRLTGVDIIGTSYQGENFLDQYSAVISGDASVEVTKISENRKKFNFVIAHGVPPKVIEDSIEKGDVKDIVSPGGTILFVFDIPIKESSMIRAKEIGFEFHKGTFPSDPNILVWQNRSVS